MDQNYVLNKLKMPDKAEQLDKEYLPLYSNLNGFRRTPFFIIFDLHFKVGEKRFKALTIIGTSVDGILSRVLSVRLSHKERRLGATEVALDLRNLIHAGKCLQVYENMMAVVSDQCILNTQCKKILTLPMIPDYDHLIVTIARKFSVAETVLNSFLKDLKTNPSPDIERYLERVPHNARNFYREIMKEYFKALHRMRAHSTRDFSEANTIKLENLGRGWKGAISKWLGHLFYLAMFRGRVVVTQNSVIFDFVTQAPATEPPTPPPTEPAPSTSFGPPPLLWFRMQTPAPVAPTLPKEVQEQVPSMAKHPNSGPIGGNANNPEHTAQPGRPLPNNR